MEKKKIDYGNMSTVRRVRYYRSPDRDRPLDEWELVADKPILAPKFNDDLTHKTGKSHFYYCRYVFVDGELSGASDIVETKPITDPSQIKLKQNRDLN